MVKSPWSITGRQNFWTSRVQDFCSSAVPLRDGCGCWAKAPDEAVSDNRVSARRNLRIVFLHFGSKNPVPRFAMRRRRNGFVWMAGAALRGDEQMTSMVNADIFTAT